MIDFYALVWSVMVKGLELILGFLLWKAVLGLYPDIVGLALVEKRKAEEPE